MTQSNYQPMTIMKIIKCSSIVQIIIAYCANYSNKSFKRYKILNTFS